MKKLGYRFFSKDWRTNEKVFNLTLEMRGFYREFIDFAYENDNNFTINHKYWCRMLGINKRKFDTLFARLLSDNLIQEDKGIYQIPSVEARIQLIRGGQLGGETSKPPRKPTLKPDSNQRKDKYKDKGKGVIPTYQEFKEHAISKNDNTDFSRLKLKYESWKENDWTTGHDKPIKNWRSTLTNTLPHIRKAKTYTDRL